MRASAFSGQWLARLRARLPLHGMHAFGAPIEWRPGLPAVVLAFAVLAYQSVWAWLALSFGWVVVMLVHELGHAYVARRLGYNVDLIAIGGFHGCCEMEAPDYEWHDVAIAWGGAGAQIALAVPAGVLFWTLHQSLPPELLLTLLVLSKFNAVVACFNLLPISGFDGRVAWRVIPLSWDWWRANRATQRVLKRIAKRREK